MELVIKNYYNFKQNNDLEIFSWNNNKKYYISSDKFIKNKNNAIINLTKLKSDKYIIKLSQLKEIEYIFKIKKSHKKIVSKTVLYIKISSLKDTIKVKKLDSSYFKKKVKYPLKKYWNKYWMNLHWLAYNYPNKPTNDNKLQINKLIKQMIKISIPCSICRMHFIDWTSEHNINKHLNNRDELFRYFVDLHNNVNMRKNKKIVSYKEAYNIFSDKKWTYKLSKYGINIIDLFNKNKLKEFPELFYKQYKS